MDAVLQAGELELETRRIDCKPAVPKDQIGQVQPQQQQQPVVQRVKKIFVGGLLPETTETEFKDYFSKFGEVTEGHKALFSHTSVMTPL